MDTRNILKERNKRRLARILRVREKVSGTPERPRLALFRSNRYLYAQVIDDTVGKTLVSASSREPAFLVKSSKKNVEVARDLGRVIGERAKARGILKMVFDRRWYRYHGRVKAFVEGVREAGIEI